MNHRNQLATRSRRGIALVLVLTAIALASVIGFAVLSTSALQTQITSNATQQTASEYLAESGVQAALYYLQYPHLMPPSWGTTPGYVMRATDVTLPDVVGCFDLEVLATSTRDQYTIKSVGRSSQSVGATSHTMTASAKVARTTITGAAIFGGNITLPLGVTVDGPIQINGMLTNLTGTVLAVIAAPLPPSAYRVPELAGVNMFGAERADRAYTMPDGTIGYAQQLASAPVTTPVASADNPGKVFFYSNATTPDLLLTSGVTIDGTLVVKGGSLGVRAAGIRINPVAGMPALVVEKDVNLYRTNNTLEANGAVWIGRNITWSPLMGSSSGTRLIVNGSLLMPAGSAIGSPGTSGTISLKYDAGKVDAPLLSRSLQPGQSVTLLSWND